jgi:methanogenic corrinoid protein MtbC1
VKSFGNRIKNLRKKLNLTQKYLAKELNLSQTAIGNYEKDIRFPNKDVLILFSNYFNVSLDYLICGSEFIYKKEKLNFDLESVKDLFLNLLMVGKSNEAYILIRDLLKSDIKIENIYIDIFEYTLKEVGRLYELGKIEIYKEHYISNMVLEIISQISPKLIDFNNTNNKKVLGVCAGFDEHFIGLKLVMNYLKIKGLDTYFLGTALPTKEVLESIKFYDAKYILISATLKNSLPSVTNLVKAIIEQDKDIKIIVGGRVFNERENLYKEIKANFHSKSIKDIFEYISLNDIYSK